MGRAVDPRHEGIVAERRPGPSRPSARLVLWAGAAALVVAGFAVSLGERAPGRGLDAAPAAALGLWTTDDPRYVGRSLRLTNDAVVVGVGPAEAPHRGEIRSIRVWQEGLVRVLRIEYDAGEGPEAMDLLLVGPDSMRLRNPREVLWTRAR